MVRILHCADLHIDSLFSGSSAREAATKRTELLSAFSKAIEVAKYARVQLFLIAGDFFDSNLVNYDTISALSREMASYPECRFVISPGNHDPYIPKGAYDSSAWPSNVYIFKSSKINKFSFDDINTDVYGYAFESPAMRECPLDGFSPDSNDKINIILAHGDYDNMITNYCPLPKNMLDSLDADYIALGHIHKGKTDYNGEKYAYSGCILGRALDETGQKGFLIGEVGKSIRKLKFCPASNKIFDILTLDISDFATKNELSEAIKALISKYEKNSVLRIVFTGIRSSKIEKIKIDEDLLSTVDKIEIKDETTQQTDFSVLSSDKTVKGAVYAELKQYLENADAEQRKIGKKALDYVLSALSGQNIFD